VIVSVLACSAAAAPGVCRAQASSATLEEIVVTAQRRESNLQSVPAAVSALTADAIQSAGIVRIDNLANSVPNVYIDTGASLRATVIAVRGISSNPNNPGVDPAVGVFVDGVYQGRPTTMNSALYDLDRVEFLRGPQGALYGKNTIAGAINFITKLPSAEPSGEFRLGYGNYDQQQAYAAVSGPLGSERLTARLSGSYQQRDGYLDNTATGTDLDDADEVGGRLALALAATDTLDLVLRADTARNRTASGASEVFLNGAFTGAPFADADPYDRRVANDRDAQGDRDQSGVSLQADWDTALGRITSITAYRQFDWENMNDNDFSVLNMLSSGISEDYGQFSQELRLVSKGGTKLDYVVGLYYEDQSLDTVSTAIVGPDLGIYPDEVAGEIFGDVESTGWAAYAQGTWRFSDRWSLSAGLRYSDEQKDVTHSQVGDPFQILLPTYPQQKLSRDDSQTSPSVSVNWQPNETMLAYVSYAQGFKAGGFNVFSITPTDEARYDPELVDSYEIGLKSTLLDGAARLNIALFTLTYDDLQVNQLVLVGGVPQYQTSNAASAESKGAEVELLWQATEGLQLSAAYGYTDASFDSFKNATQDGDDYSGNVLPLAAENTLNAAVQYAAPVFGDFVFRGRLEANWRDDVFFDPSNDPLATQDSFTTVDARIALEAGAGWSIGLWGRNLTDEDYALVRSAGVIVPGQYTHQLAAPRTYGIEVGYEF
jgi:iron complex outermembrane receptor protein